MSKQAFDTKNNTVVSIISVNGGWTTVFEHKNGKEYKVRNGQLGPVPATEAQPVKAKTEKKATPKKEKMPRYRFHTNDDGEPCCPKCGSTEVYQGRLTEDHSKVVDDDSAGGCRECGWSFGQQSGTRNIGKSKYDPANYRHVKSATGSVSLDCGDRIAKKLEGKTLDEVYELAAKFLQIGEKELRKKYEHLNPGMQRMNLGNRLRSLSK